MNTKVRYIIVEMERREKWSERSGERKRGEQKPDSISFSLLLLLLLPPQQLLAAVLLLFMDTQSE